jgi:RNA polymerase sigma-70 factor (ECF subfamily)
MSRIVMPSDSIPKNDHDFDQFQTQFIAAAAADPAHGVEAPEVARLQAEQAAWNVTFAEYAKARDAFLAATERKDAARSVLAEDIRATATRSHGPTLLLAARPAARERGGSALLRAAPPASAPAARVEQRFPAIYEEHSRLVWSILRKSGIGRADAEDIRQDVFVELHAQLAANRGVIDNIPAMLRTLTRNALLHHARGCGRARIEFGLDEAEVPAIEPDAGDAIDHKRLVADLMARLSDEHREVLELMVLQGNTGEEAAELLELPVGTVRNRYLAAIERCKKLLRGRLPPRRRTGR